MADYACYYRWNGDVAMKCVRRLMVSLLGVLVSMSVLAEPVKLATSKLVSSTFPEIQSIVVEAFEGAGHAVELTELPGERAMVMLRANQIDAEVMRLVSYNEQVPNAVPVEVPLITLQLFAIVHEDSASLSHEDLRGRKMAAEPGVKVADLVAQRFDAQILYQNRMEDSAKMVQSGRVDFSIMTRPMIRSLRDSGFELKAIEEPVLEIPYYIWLSEEKAHLKPGLTEQLHRMREAGRF